MLMRLFFFSVSFLCNLQLYDPYECFCSILCLKSFKKMIPFNMLQVQRSSALSCRADNWMYSVNLMLTALII